MTDDMTITHLKDADLLDASVAFIDAVRDADPGNLRRVASILKDEADDFTNSATARRLFALTARVLRAESKR